MTFILDNIIAILIGGTILLSLAATQLQIQETGVAQVSSHTAKTKMLSFGQWIEEDIVALGENVINDNARFDNPSISTFTTYICVDGSPVAQTITYTTSWYFYSDRLSGGVNQRQATRYRLVQQGTPFTVELACGSSYTRPLFQLERAQSIWKAVDAADNATFTSADFLDDGRSVSTLTKFHIELLDNNGDPFSAVDPDAPEQASYVRADFSMVPELELRRDYLRELYWTTTLKVRPFWS